MLGGGATARNAYVEALRAYGKDAEKPRIAAAGRWIFCTREPGRDWPLLREHAFYQLRNYATWFYAAGQPALGDPPADLPDLESHGLYCVATPEEIIEVLRAQHAAAPFERHYFWAIWPGVEIAMATRSVRLFAEEVIPALRDL